MSSALHTALRTTVSRTKSSSPIGARSFGFDSSRYDLNGAGPSNPRSHGHGWGDEARNPVVRDSLVPIVVEQTVSSLIFSARR